MLNKIKSRLRTKKLIRAAINTYPGGICFADCHGRPILVNGTFNIICNTLTGSTVINADTTWSWLKRIAELDTNADFSSASNKEIIVCKTPDAKLWQFQRSVIAPDNVMQYEADDITALCEYRARLEENNKNALELLNRQHNLLKNIVRNNLEKELLSAKIRIHDNFGKCLIATKRVIDGKDMLSTGFSSTWINCLDDLENSSHDRDTADFSPESELIKAASLIGCKLEFIGNQPEKRKPLLLLYAAIREALTNAVRHANADKLIVKIDDCKNCYHVSITHNGETKTKSVQEGTGLRNLRQRLEKEGALMRIECLNGVEMLLVLPKE